MCNIATHAAVLSDRVIAQHLTNVLMWLAVDK